MFCFPLVPSNRLVDNNTFFGVLLSCCTVCLWLFLSFLQEALGDAVIKSGARLEELDLSDNAFGPDGVQAATRLLASPACSSLTTLKFHNNGLGIGGGKVSGSC